MFGYQFLLYFLQNFDVVGNSGVLGRRGCGVQFPEFLNLFIVIISFLLELLVVKEHVVATDV